MPYKNKEDRLAANRKSYANNKVDRAKKTNERRKRYKLEWTQFKARLSCVICGEDHPAALDFHHIAPNKSDRKVYKLVANGAFAAAVEEIKKCVVFCASCHRKHHADERKNLVTGT